MEIDLSEIKKEVDEIDKSIKPINIYTVTFVISGYKQEIDIDNIYTNIYFDYENAKKDMLRICEKYYEESDIIQEEENKFFDEFTDNNGNYCIMFGENDDNPTGYRVEWGMAKLEKFNNNEDMSNIKKNIKSEYIKNKIKKIKFHDLKIICKNNNIHNYSKLKKNEIIEKIENHIY